MEAPPDAPVELMAALILEGDAWGSCSLIPSAIQFTDVPEAGETADIDCGEKSMLSELCEEYWCGLVVAMTGDATSLSWKIVSSLAAAGSTYL